MIPEKKRLPVGVLQPGADEARLGLPQGLGRLVLAKRLHLVLQGKQ